MAAQQGLALLADAAIVGQALAARRGLTVGQRFTISDITTTIAATFASDTPAEENLL